MIDKKITNNAIKNKTIFHSMHAIIGTGNILYISPCQLSIGNNQDDYNMNNCSMPHKVTIATSCKEKYLDL